MGPRVWQRRRVAAAKDTGFFLSGGSMSRVMFFIEGFNVYHSLKEKKKYHKYLWLNYHALAQCVIKTNETVSGVLYFSAYPLYDNQKTKRHKIFVSALKNEGVSIVLSNFKDKQRYCNLCKRWYWTREEKQTDVSIGVYLYKEAHLDRYDKAVLVTNDTDLVPAIKIVKQEFPQKKIGVLFPIDRQAAELKQVCDFWMYTKRQHLKKSQFPGQVRLPSGVVLTRPPTWV
jgi:uncharacterized LabA/DUF88 family protein